MEANWQMVVTLAAITSLAIYLGYVCFKRWFNPFSIYSAIWGFCLCNYELRLIQYYPISKIAWTYIGFAWVSIFFGSITGLLLSSRKNSSSTPELQVDLTRLRKVILGLSVLGGVGFIGQLVAITRQFGNPLIALILNSNDVYGARISGELSGLSYIGDCSYAACALAGIYTAKVSKITHVTIIPIVLVTLQLIALAGRTGLGIAAILFVTSFAYTPRSSRFQLSKVHKIIATASIAALLLGGFFFVSFSRHLNVDFPGITPAMEEISDYIPPFPSLYSNFSATPVAFSAYLSNPQDDGDHFWGMYTFAPVWRFLSHLGFRTGVAPYEESYYTPVPMNTGTYLKNVHSDFGFAGILIFPYLLGAAVTLLIMRASATPKLVGLVVLSHVFVLVVFTFAFDFMVLGDWYISAVVSVAGALMAKRTGLSRDRAGATLGVSSNVHAQTYF